MSRLQVLLIVLGVCTEAFVTAAEAPSLNGEVLIQGLPPGFKVGFRNGRDGMTMQELIPERETVDNWSKMITTQIFKGKADWLPGKFLVSFGERFAAACPNLRHTNIMNGSANGYPTSFLILECANNPATNKPENVYVRAIQGKDSFYAVQFAYRSAVDDAEKAVLGKYLESIVACDTRSAEHPCRGRAEAGIKPQ